MRRLEEEIDSLCQKGKEHHTELFCYQNLPHHHFIQTLTETKLKDLKAETEWQIWHQRLGHQLDHAMHTASKFIDGVLQFSRQEPQAKGQRL